MHESDQHFRISVYSALQSLIPGMSFLLGRIYKPREGDRQPLHFKFRTLRKYRSHRKAALSSSVGTGDFIYAFIGKRDHYRRSGVVSLRTWKKHFGKSFQLYDGTHFTEEEYIDSMVIPKILEVLK